MKCIGAVSASLLSQPDMMQPESNLDHTHGITQRSHTKCARMTLHLILSLKEELVLLLKENHLN